MALLTGGATIPQILKVASNGCSGGCDTPVLETILEVYLSYHAGRGYGRMAEERQCQNY